MSPLPASLSDKELLDQALAELGRAARAAGSDPALAALVDRLNPVIHARVARTLVRYGRWNIHARLQQAAHDQVQLVWAKLFEDQARVLRAWSEHGGLSLADWVSRFSGLRTRDMLRAAHREPRMEDGEVPEVLALVAGDGTPEDHHLSRDLWQKVRAALLAEQSSLGRTLFELLIEQDLSTQDVCDRTNMNANAVQQWRSRLRAGIRRWILELSGAPSTGDR